MRDDDFEADLPPSKSQRKRDMDALQALGRELLEAPDSLLDKLELPERLRGALAEFKRLPNKNEAKRRQLQYIGKLMREADREAVERALHDARQGSEAEKRRLHALEDLRERLLEDDAALEALLREQPGLDIQALRQLIRQARHERGTQAAPAASRKLFRFLRESLPED